MGADRGGGSDAVGTVPNYKHVLNVTCRLKSMRYANVCVCVLTLLIPTFYEKDSHFACRRFKACGWASLMSSHPVVRGTKHA